MFNAVTDESELVSVPGSQFPTISFFGCDDVLVHGRSSVSLVDVPPVSYHRPSISHTGLFILFAQSSIPNGNISQDKSECAMEALSKATNTKLYSKTRQRKTKPRICLIAPPVYLSFSFVPTV